MDGGAPPHFGTGTEDDYGYVWCCNVPFEAMTVKALSEALPLESQNMKGYAKQTFSGDTRLWVVLILMCARQN